MSEKNTVTIRDKNSLFKKTNTLDEPDIEIEIYSLEEIKSGDHIVLSKDLKYCHAIVESVNIEKSVIEIIYYDDDQTQCSLDEFSLLNIQNCEKDEKSCKVNGVKQATLFIELENIKIYRVDYSLTKETCLETEKTLEKARKHIGQVKYNIFANNDEHFAIYCKTGKAAKLFIINPNDITAKNLIGKDISEKIVGNLAQQGGNILLVNTAKHIATKFPRSAISAGLPVAAEVAGSAIGIGIEGISMGYDIRKKYKEYKTGKVTKIKFKKYIAKRVTRGAMGVAGGVSGGILGQMVIPIPVVGAVVGSVVGGIVGAVVGHGEGILIGRLVEVIDEKNTTKEKQKNDTTFKENIDIDINKKKYHVLDKILFKFNKGEYDKQSDFDDQISIKYNPSTEDIQILSSDLVLKNINSEINQEDYEIFELNDTKEIITDLNIEDSFDENGAINKRRSLEVFSGEKLSDELNVFVKISESEC